MRTRVCAWIVGLLLVVATSALAAGDAGLIPRQVLFGNPDKAAPRLSPDGTKISYLAPVDGVLNVWVAPLDKPRDAKPVTHSRKRPITQSFWAHTNRHIVYLQDSDGDENWRVYSVDVATGAEKNLTPEGKVQARISGVSHLFPEEILVGLNDRNPQLHDLYRVNVRTGERKLILKNPGYVATMEDDNYVPRLGFTFTLTAGLKVVRLKDDGSAGDTVAEIGPEDIFTTNPVGFDKTGNVLYMLDGRKRDKAALATLDLTTMRETLIAQDPKCDIGGVMLHPTEKTVQAYSTEYEREDWHAVDPKMGADLSALKAVARGDVTVTSRTLDDSKWLVLFHGDDAAPLYYLYDRATRRATYLFTPRKELLRTPLARMHPVIVKSRDGLELVCYLTLPKGSASGDSVKPSHPLPLVLWIHGGPWARDSWGLDPVHQWLANRGYAVLSVNYRGSTGFGKRFVNAANHEWGRKMHDDVLDAAKWAIANGIADPKRIAITGGSYGGYETLVGVTMTPDTFACGVDLVGISNLITWLKNVPQYWIPILPLLKDRVGDASTDEGRAMLTERSPLTHADKIKKPLLIGQGANDPRVPQRESDQLVKAMRDHGIPVTYLLYSDEGHGFGRTENSLSFWAVMEAFLAKHLGGRYEPVGKDFTGSTVKALAGVDQVPGLAEALAGVKP